MDGSGPPKANAAQLAQRNIKATKGRRLGGRAAPVGVQGNAQFGQSQGAPPAQFGGGLFGGGIQAPVGGSGFNFAVAGAPPAPSFHNPFQQASNSDISDNDDRRDPAEERPNKRRSGGTASGDSMPLFAPNPYSQEQQPSMFGAGNSQQQNGGSFSFGQSTGFNSAAATNPFAQGGTSVPAAAPAIKFGGSGQSNSASSPFKFGQPSPQIETASTGFKFGSAATPAKPASSLFSFGQTSGQPASSGISFGSMPATDAPANNLFGTSQPPSTNLFGSVAPQPTPGPFANLNTPAVSSSNLFGSREASPAPSANSSNLFGNQEQASKPSVSNSLFSQSQQTKPASNFFGTPGQGPTSSTLFGQSQQTAPSVSTLFGGSSQPPTTSTLFSEQKSQNPGNLFGNMNSTPSAASTMFSKPAEKPSMSNDLFGTTPKPAAPSNDLFGSLNKPVEQAVTDIKTRSTSMFGTSENQSKSSNPFGQPASSSDLFKGSSSLASAPSISQPISATSSKPLFSFASSQASPAPSTESSKPNMPSSTKTMEAPTSASDPPPSGMFPSLQQSALQRPPMMSSSPLNNAARGPPVNAAIQNSAYAGPEKNVLHNGSNFKSLLLAKNLTEEFMDSLMPQGFGENERKDFYVAYRLRALNYSLADYLSTLKSMADPEPAFNCYKEERTLIADDHRVRIAKKRTFPHEAGSGEETPSKRNKQADFNTTQSPAPGRRAPSPVKQQSGINNLKPYTNGNSAISSPAKTPVLAPPPSNNPPVSAGKRKASDDLNSQNVQAADQRPLRQIKTPKSIKSSDRQIEEPSGGSNTSNIFKNILDSPAQSPQKSPTKKTANLPSTSKDIASKPNPFGGLPVPKSPTKDSPAKPNPFGGLPVPKSPTKSAALSPSAGLFGAKPVAPIQFTSPSPNLFGSKTSEASKPTIPASPSPNLFGSTPTQTSGLFGSTPSLPPSNPFGSKAAESPKSTMPALASSNMFGSNPPSNAAPPASKGFSIPGLSGGAVNFAAQFGQKAEQDKITSEQKKMQHDMDEDFDSEDDDKEEWIANWKEKRRVELENLDALTKSSKGGFTFSQPKTKEPVTDIEAKQSSKPLFGLSATSQSQSNGVFSPGNISRTPTPGAISSGTGSVFDSHAPGKLAPFSNNIFGHLSDSAKSDDADDESAEDSDPEADGDSENKDPNYTPQQESKSGPGTPASETGAGIASAKKSNMFASTPSRTTSIFGASASGTTTPRGGLFGAPASGTTTPRGGLFDRISRDSNGNPIRATSIEEKENAQPTPTAAVLDIKNPFSALNKSQPAPADQTWKIDSPIKFGTTPTNDNKTPTFNLTAATPTKAGSPAGIFGNLSNGPTSAPFSNLFGNLGASKPAAAPGVGFSFGGVSNTSSLFPSATTSRATSPGATTDGDSAAEDPDAEKHEQINLTAGGPGEEDEEVVFEVRVKARQFTNKEGAESAWETKGLGPLRILKHKETNATRMLLRADPRGTIVFNKAILNFKYEATGSTVKLTTAGEKREGFETWVVQVKTAESARQLAEALEANKLT